MDLIFLGPPGAGKGTQARRVAQALGAVHFSTGDLLRDAFRRATPLGLEARVYMDRGDLVPDEVVDRMVADRLAGEKSDVLFDGYPRNLAQARALDLTEERLGRSAGAVVLLEVADDVLERRLGGRRSCPKCSAMYHVESQPPSVAGRCDACGSELVVRSDDRAEVVRDRLRVYHRETEPLVDHYGARDIVKRVDGSGGIDGVTRSVLLALDRS